ncbi:hypothetical protein RRG08_033729 [Elysia crispata]|uniref:Uncharacterized protein n=1 Tax=Elysia crispata TaxID=231223 RepID=A0AAE1A9H3_9GAST|nr:hypothetical protein RRG08_033729 [Elysia crispata]
MVQSTCSRQERPQRRSGDSPFSRTSLTKGNNQRVADEPRSRETGRFIVSRTLREWFFCASLASSGVRGFTELMHVSMVYVSWGWVLTDEPSVESFARKAR